MSKDEAARYGLVLVVFFAHVTAARGQLTVPRFLVDAAEWPVIEFARVLASSSVPAGVELHETDALKRPPLRLTGDATDRTPRADLLMRFNGAHEDYARGTGSPLACDH